MSVDEINLAIGQRWKTRDGQEVEIVGNDGHSIYPWELSNGVSVTDEGFEWKLRKSDGDLITLIQDEHGFIPWNGGECPVKRSTLVEVKFRDGRFEEDFGNNFDWSSTGAGWNIIAYRVVKQGEKQTGQSKETVVETKEEPKYTIKEVFSALDKVNTEFEHWDYYEDVVHHLAKTQDPDYKLYLELKAKFE